MAHSPESMPENPIDFRAPPPSPIASGRRSSVTNDDVLSEFLEHSLRVPDLVLPDKIFPRQKIVEKLPVIDFQSLNSAEKCNSVSRILDSLARIGCFQVVNFGVPFESIRLVLTMAAGIFSLSPEKRTAVMRSPEKPFGFEEVHGEEESEVGEEFVWCRDKSLKSDMEGIWPVGYSKFSEKMETLLSDIENVAEKILSVLTEISMRKSLPIDDIMEGQGPLGTLCYIYKHRNDVPADKWAASLGYNVIRMLIRGTDYSHALCFHIFEESSEFHVYSKKGWVSFCPDKDAIVVTAGDQIQVLSGGQFKHVIGRPIFKGEKDYISMAFLYSPPPCTSATTAVSAASAAATISTATAKPNKPKTISLGQQALLVIVLTLIYHFVVCCYKDC